MAGQVVVVTGGSGGPGTTSLAVGLSAAMVTVGANGVLLVDLDPAGGDVAAYLAAAGSFGADHGMHRFVPLTDPARLTPTRIARQCVSVADGWWVLPGLLWPDDRGLLSAPLLRLLLEGCRRLTVDAVVVDTGRLLPGASATRLLAGADIAQLTVRPDRPGVLAASRALGVLPDLPPSVSLRLVAVGATRASRAVVDDLTPALSFPVAGVVPADPRAARRAALAGWPPLEGRLARAYLRLAETLVRLDGPYPPSAEPVVPLGV